MTEESWLLDNVGRAPRAGDEHLEEFLDMLGSGYGQGDPLPSMEEAEETLGDRFLGPLAAVGAIYLDEMNQWQLDPLFLDYSFPRVRTATCMGCGRLFFDSHKEDWSFGAECRDCVDEAIAKD